MKTSIVQLKAELKEVAEENQFLNDFFWGAPDRSWNESPFKYPCMVAYIAGSGASMSRNQTTVPLVIAIADKEFKDMTNRVDTLSDTMRIHRQLMNVFRSPRWKKIGRVQTGQMTKWREKGDDEITGWSQQFTFVLRDTESYCDLPMPGYDFEGSTGGGGGDCDPATIINSNAQYFEQVASGATFELPDTAVNVRNTASDLVNTGSVPSVSGGDVTAPDAIAENTKGAFIQNIPAGTTGVIPDVVINNSDLSYTRNLPANTINVLDDITHTDSDGSLVTLPAQTPFVATPCSTSIIYDRPIPSGQWTTFRTGDDGDQAQAGTYDDNSGTGVLQKLDTSVAAFFTTLDSNTPNFWSGTDRFTNDIGGTVTNGSDGSTANYVVDNLTGIGYAITVQSATTWNNFIDGALALTVGPYSDFFPPPSHYLESISQNTLASVFNYPPFNIVQGLWSSSTYGINTANAVWFNAIGPETNRSKTGTSTWIACRIHFA